MRRMILLLSTVVAPLAFASGDGYSYQNCADQRLRLPLRECASIGISKDLSTVEIRDTGEAGMSVGDPTGAFHVLNSTNVPLAVPIDGYGSSDRWEYRSNTYLKISRGKTRYFDWQRQPADTIAVVPVSALKDGDFGDMSYVAGNTRLVFWYSEIDGITAIGFPALGRQSGEVFYCSISPCLFAQKP